MTDFIAAISPDALGNWEICKRERLWGVIQKGRGHAGANTARGVRRGDRVYIWLGKPKRGRAPSGLVAEVEVLGPFEAAKSGVRVPWPDPRDYAGVFPIRVVAELPTPVGDTFDSKTRISRHFGISNMDLIHGFRPLNSAVAAKVASVFPRSRGLEVGRAYSAPSPPSPRAAAMPFDVDPDLVDRALLGHHSTIERLAIWLRGKGLEPRLPIGLEPSYDLAWMDGDVLNVAEVKSITATNEESQLRLGLGQVLRYRHHLRTTRADVAEVKAWLVPEREPMDASWRATCSASDVVLFPPPP